MKVENDNGFNEIHETIKNKILATDVFEEVRELFQEYKQHSYYECLENSCLNMIELKWDDNDTLNKYYLSNKEEVEKEIKSMEYECNGLIRSMINMEVIKSMNDDDDDDFDFNFSSESDVLYDNDKAENVYIVGWLWDKNHEMMDDYIDVAVEWFGKNVEEIVDFQTGGSLRVITESFLNENKEQLLKNYDIDGTDVLKLENFTGRIKLRNTVLLIDGDFTNHVLDDSTEEPENIFEM